MSAATTIELAPPAPAASAARVATFVGATGAVVLALSSVGGADDVTAATWVRAVIVAAWGAAALVLATRGNSRFATVAMLAGVAGGVCAVTANEPDLSRVHIVAASILPAIALHLELTAPDGQFGNTVRRGACIAVYTLALAFGVVLGVAEVTPSVAAMAAAVVAVLVAGLPTAHDRYRRSTGNERQRLQLIGCSVAVVVEVALVVGSLHALVDWPRLAGEVAAASTALVPLALIAGTSGKIARRVDRVLVHTVSATGLTAVVVVVYLLVVIGLGRTPAEDERSLLILSMMAAAVATIAYIPARERLAEAANRLVYGERHPPDEVLRTWGARLSRAIPMDELLLQLAESLRKVLDLRRAEVWTGSGLRFELAVAVPGREATPLVLTAEEGPVVARAGVTGNAWLEVWLPSLLSERAPSQLRVAPAAHSGELLGLLVIERAVDADPFSEEDDRVLAELARQVALALHNVQLDSALQESLENLERANADLRASRARIVATGDAERRKIERNLHDGAQQHLVALAVNLRLTKDILTDDPTAAAEMLDALAVEVKETIQELRNLAHGIYPPLLMDSGLLEALRAAAARSPLDVEVHADDIGRYSSEIEAAVYFCCLEAMQNAAKHAPDAHVVVELRADSGALSFTVADDGPGFDAEAAAHGHGYVNMSDRLGAIGGAVEWRSSPGAGATVTGMIPAGPSPSAS